MNRKKYLSNQLGKNVQEPGAHMAHAAVGVLLKKRRKKEQEYYVKGGSSQKPIKEYDPFPSESLDYKYGGVTARDTSKDGE